MSKDFDEMKQKMLEENEKSFGDEIRENYGEDVLETSKNIIQGLTEEQWAVSELLRQQAEDLLKELAPDGDPDSEKAHQMAELHGAWASTFWENGEYYPEMHLALAAMYTEDERFISYYDAIVPGGAAFLKKAIENYCK